MKSNFLTLASNAPSSMSSILLFLMLNSLASEYTEPLSRTPISLSYIETLIKIELSQSFSLQLINYHFIPFFIEFN